MVFRTLEIRHYGPACDVSETGLYGSSGLEKSLLGNSASKLAKNGSKMLTQWF